MIRFVVKCALVIGLAATVLPLATGTERASAPAVDLFGLAAGLREAAADFGGFCERAPQACAAAGEVAAFTADRIEAGLAIGYDYLGAALRTERDPEALDTADAADPLLTGAVEAFGPPRPYTPPRSRTNEAAVATTTVAIPTPAPRT